MLLCRHRSKLSLDSGTGPLSCYQAAPKYWLLSTFQSKQLKISNERITTLLVFHLSNFNLIAKHWQMKSVMVFRLSCFEASDGIQAKNIFTSQTLFLQLLFVSVTVFCRLHFFMFMTYFPFCHRKGCFSPFPTTSSLPSLLQRWLSR